MTLAQIQLMLLITQWCSPTVGLSTPAIQVRACRVAIINCTNHLDNSKHFMSYQVCFINNTLEEFKGK